MFSKDLEPNFEEMDKIIVGIFGALNKKPALEVYLSLIHAITYIMATTSEDSQVEERAKLFCDELMFSIQNRALVMKRFSRPPSFSN